MTEWIAIGLSIVAIGISAVTAWLTLLRGGRLCMTRPTMVFLGPDGGGGNKKKVFLRTLLYSTSHQGQVVESIYVNVQRGETRQNFSFWAYRDETGGIVRGSGLFVGQHGVSLDHHFLLPDDSGDFRFSPGRYVIRVFAKRVADKMPHLLYEFALDVSESKAKGLEAEGAGIFFDWGPEQQMYYSRVEVRGEERNANSSRKYVTNKAQ